MRSWSLNLCSKDLVPQHRFGFKIGLILLFSNSLFVCSWEEISLFPMCSPLTLHPGSPADWLWILWFNGSHVIVFKLFKFLLVLEISWVTLMRLLLVIFCLNRLNSSVWVLVLLNLRFKWKGSAKHVRLHNWLWHVVLRRRLVVIWHILLCYWWWHMLLLEWLTNRWDCFLSLWCLSYRWCLFRYNNWFSLYLWTFFDLTDFFSLYFWTFFYLNTFVNHNWAFWRRNCFLISWGYIVSSWRNCLYWNGVWFRIEWLNRRLFICNEHLWPGWRNTLFRNSLWFFRLKFLEEFFLVTPDLSLNFSISLLMNKFSYLSIARLNFKTSFLIHSCEHSWWLF